MKLTEEQQKDILNKLSFLKNSKCCICGSNNWIISDTVFEIREFFEGAIVLGHTSILPLISATCGKCSNTIFFNILTLGIQLKEK